MKRERSVSRSTGGPRNFARSPPWQIDTPLGGGTTDELLSVSSLSTSYLSLYLGKQGRCFAVCRPLPCTRRRERQGDEGGTLCRAPRTGSSGFFHSRCRLDGAFSRSRARQCAQVHTYICTVRRARIECGRGNEGFCSLIRAQRSAARWKLCGSIAEGLPSLSLSLLVPRPPLSQTVGCDDGLRSPNWVWLTRMDWLVSAGGSYQ